MVGLWLVVRCCILGGAFVFGGWFWWAPCCERGDCRFLVCHCGFVGLVALGYWSFT